MQVFKSESLDGDFIATVIDESGEIGAYWRNPYGIFASPRNSQIQSIPCDSEQDAIDTCVRLGRVLPGNAPFLLTS